MQPKVLLQETSWLQNDKFLYELWLLYIGMDDAFTHDTEQNIAFPSHHVSHSIIVFPSQSSCCPLSDQVPLSLIVFPYHIPLIWNSQDFTEKNCNDQETFQFVFLNWPTAKIFHVHDSICTIYTSIKGEVTWCDYPSPFQTILHLRHR